MQGCVTEPVERDHLAPFPPQRIGACGLGFGSCAGLVVLAFSSASPVGRVSCRMQLHERRFGTAAMWPPYSLRALGSQTSTRAVNAASGLRILEVLGVGLQAHLDRLMRRTCNSGDSLRRVISNLLGDNRFRR